MNSIYLGCKWEVAVGRKFKWWLSSILVTVATCGVTFGVANHKLIPVAAISVVGVGSVLASWFCLALCTFSYCGDTNLYVKIHKISKVSVLQAAVAFIYLGFLWAYANLNIGDSQYALGVLFVFLEILMRQAVSIVASWYVDDKYCFIVVFPTSVLGGTFWLVLFLANATKAAAAALLIAVQVFSFLVLILRGSAYYYVHFVAGKDPLQDRQVMQRKFQAAAFIKTVMHACAHTISVLVAVVGLLFLKYGWNEKFYPSIRRMSSNHLTDWIIPAILVYLVALWIFVYLSTYAIGLNKIYGPESYNIKILPKKLVTKYYFGLSMAACYGCVIPFVIALEHNGVSSISTVS